MKKWIAAAYLAFAAIVLAIAFPARSLASVDFPESDNLYIYLSDSGMRVSSAKLATATGITSGKPTGTLRLGAPGNLVIVVNQDGAPWPANATSIDFKLVIDDPAKAVTATIPKPTAAGAVAGTVIPGSTAIVTQPSKPSGASEYPDSVLTITFKRSGGLPDITWQVNILAARRSMFFTALAAGAIYTKNYRKTYSLVDAYDASGNQIPDRKRIQEDRNDNAISSTITGKAYYLFGEHQDGFVYSLQRLLSAGLYHPGGNRFGLFIGIATDKDNPPSYQLGASYFPNRDPVLAISYGLNFIQGQTLTGGFKSNDIVNLPGIDSISQKKWQAGFFFSLTYNPPPSSP